MQYNLAIIYNAQTGDITMNVLRYDVMGCRPDETT